MIRSIHERKIKMKKILLSILITVMALGFAGCGQQEESAGNDNQQEQTQKQSPKEDGKVLIAYFSRVGNVQEEDGVDAVASASVQVVGGQHEGNTKIIADMIQEETGGDLFFIEMEEKYDVDDYDGFVDAAQGEGSQGIRPALASHVEDMESYDTIYLGFPNWWFDMPMAVYSFLEEYDLAGKTIVPFCTSGGSGFSDAIAAIEEAQPEANVAEGLHIYQDDVPSAGDEVRQWLNRL